MQNYIRSTVKYIKKNLKKKCNHISHTKPQKNLKKQHNNLYTNPTKSVALHGEKKLSTIKC
jgi:hypothetical protein